MTGLRRALMTIGATAFVAGLISIPLAISSEHVHPPGIFLASQLVIGWSFVGTGLFMWWRRPENRLGLYMTAVGFTWLLGSLLASNDGYIFFVGELCAALPYAFLVQMLLSFPDGPPALALRAGARGHDVVRRDRHAVGIAPVAAVLNDTAL